MRLAAIAALLCAGTVGSVGAQSVTPGRVVDVMSPDGITLKASYFGPGKEGPGVLLYHQSNRTRTSWESLAQRLAAAGFHVLTVDSRGHGESGGSEARQWRPSDQDAVLAWLAGQPGVNREDLGVGGAGVLGVENAVETAHRHSAQVKSLVLLSGETFRPELEFLHQATQLPGLFVVSDEDEYPPIEQAMQLLYASASSPAKKLIHYVAEQEAPWRWYEPFDVGKVPATGGHGTDLFNTHPELSGIVVRWFMTTLVRAPGHAPADPAGAAPLLVDVAFAGGGAHARELLLEARARDVEAQLWPEVSMTEIGEGLLQANLKAAIEVFELNLFGYPESADANENMAEAYLAEHQNELARQYAEKALALLEDTRHPASSWTNTDEYRGEIRVGAQKVLKATGPAPMTGAGGSAATRRATRSADRPGFHDCDVCPEMLILPPGRFAMGSSPAEKQWAATHGATPGSVADEFPQHAVTLRSFALGRTPVTRAEYAAFVRDTSYSSPAGCGRDSFRWGEDPALSWRTPGFAQDGDDPVVCVSWNDAQAYIAWLNGRVRAAAGAPGTYRLPSESEWEYAARAGSTSYFWWGNDAREAPAHAWFKNNSGGRTHRVGSKLPNAFGLYDMAGNVWQWTQDCYLDTYAAAPADGRAIDARTRCLRVDRGGSWLFPAWLLRSATRERNPPEFRDVIMGFRVAKTLP